MNIDCVKYSLNQKIVFFFMIEKNVFVGYLLYLEVVNAFK